MLGIHVTPPNKAWLNLNQQMRPLARSYINALEEGNSVDNLKNDLKRINDACEKIYREVYEKTIQVLDKGKIAAVLGGDHSCALGILKACKEKYTSFGVLQIDAHRSI